MTCSVPNCKENLEHQINANLDAFKSCRTGMTATVKEINKKTDANRECIKSKVSWKVLGYTLLSILPLIAWGYGRYGDTWAQARAENAERRRYILVDVNANTNKLHEIDPRIKAVEEATVRIEKKLDTELSAATEQMRLQTQVLNKLVEVVNERHN